MIRKIVILLLLNFLYIVLQTTNIVQASDWDEVAACDPNADPCSCDDSDPACHPSDGADTGTTCIDTLGFQDIPGFFFQDGCAEQSPDSNFFEPSIRIRSQSCNFLLCWPEDHDLGWEGDCATMVGPYIFPLLRMCARVAMPADTIAGTLADPGYTDGVHLDFEGATVPDTPVATSDGGTMILEVPKLCAYKDPSLFSIDDGLDVMDLNPDKQPFHKSQGMLPIVESMIFLIDHAASFADDAFSMISSLFTMLGGSEGSSGSSGSSGGSTQNQDSSGGAVNIGTILSDMLSFIGDILVAVGSLITDYLKEVGQLNRAVDDAIVGCVNIPLGPYPPPFCDVLKPFSQNVVAQTICATGDDGLPIKSLQGKECVVSDLRNNYIHNAVRIGYDHYVPICQKGEDPMSTDKCVVIQNLDSFASASLMHNATNRKDIIKPCSEGSGGNGICVNTRIAHTCSNNGNGCGEGFRIVYGTTLGKTVTPRPYFRDDLGDCPSTSSVTCQTVWGINTGDFADVSLVFDPAQTEYDIAPLSGDISLDNEGKTETFTYSIYRTSEFNSTYSFTQDPSQICVFKDKDIVGCKPRATRPKVLVYDCDYDGIPGLTCESDYFNPKMIFSYSVNYKLSAADTDFLNDSTSAVIAPLTFYNASNSLNSRVNLAGDEFDAFVTDDTYQSKPFSGPKSPNPSSIYGNYLNDIPPIENNVVNQNAVYIDGLEYINGKYHLGGKYVCLKNIDYTRCPTNPKICVLTSLLARDTVPCTKFMEKFAEHKGLVLCTADQTANCGKIDSLTATDGSSIAIRSCPPADGGGSNKPNLKCYDGTEALCVTSYTLADRVDPSADLGLVLSDSQYYTNIMSSAAGGMSGVTRMYNADLYNLRDKTPVELNFCIEIPLGTCEAQTDFSEDNGFASWPEVKSGETSYGTCKTGLTPKAPLERKCVPSESKTFNFEPLYTIDENGTKTYTDVKCE